MKSNSVWPESHYIHILKKKNTEIIMSKEKYANEKQEKYLNEPSYFDGPQNNPFKWSSFLYNGKEGTVLGRDCGSWGKITNWIGFIWLWIEWNFNEIN